MANETGPRIRKMNRDDVPAALRLCRLSGWNQLQQDWAVFLELSPNDCRVAEKDGRIIGTVAVMRYGGRFSWIAMMLVDPDERRTGVGRKLLREAMTVLRGERSIRLDATPAGRQLYRLEGFEDEYPLVRMTIDVPPHSLQPVNGNVRLMRQGDFSAVLELDRDVFGADRESLLRSLFERMPDCAIIWPGSGIQGYCLGREGHLYEQIGPVVARSEEIARDLISYRLASGCGKPLAIDAPQHSTWISWLKSAGFVEGRPFVRMYWGENPFPGCPELLFGVAGPEFG